MGRKKKETSMPNGSMLVKTYAELDSYISDFVQGKLTLLMIIGRPGTSKSRSVKRALEGRTNLYVETHASAMGLYEELYVHRNIPVTIDDLDNLYSDRTAVRLLKSVCNNDQTKTCRWMTKAKNIGYGPDLTPPVFETNSSICMIANKWETINEDVRAVEDRAIILRFDPDAAEVHRKVAEWFTDQAVYDFIQDHLHMIASLSMRHYIKGEQLHGAGRLDWKERLLEICGVDDIARAVALLLADPKYPTENERAAAFTQLGHGNRSTYFDRKKRLGQFIDLPRVLLQPKPQVSVPSPVVVTDAGSEVESNEGDRVDG